MRLEEKFKQLKKCGKKAFIAYVPFGYPNISATKGICLCLQNAGVDIIELGIPFSDPLADGPIIQKATTEALSKGANMDNFFLQAGKLKKQLNIPRKMSLPLSTVMARVNWREKVYSPKTGIG